MKLITTLVAACAVGLALGAGVARAGTIQGTPIVLEHDPAGIVAARGVTEAKGNVVFSRLTPGRYAVVLPNLPRQKTAVSVTVMPSSGPPIVSAPIPMGRSGRIDVLSSSGRKLTVDVGKAGGRIQVNVSTIFDRWGNL